MRHYYDTTRTSPYGYYVTCRCGWTSTCYRTTAQDAYYDWQAHSWHEGEK